MIQIGGLQKMTLLDYPDKIAAAVFLIGCNFRCPFCHNPELVIPKNDFSKIEPNDFFEFLEKRKNVLEGVCVSGGEPLINKDLSGFLQKIKKLGYLIKLDTNGAFPDHLQKIIDQKLIDYIAMDIKASAQLYSEATDVAIDINDIYKSIDIIMSSGLDYEFRTTVIPKFHSLAEMEKIAKIIKGASKYYLQRFNNKITLNKDFGQQKAYNDKELENLKQVALKYVKLCQIRG